MGSWTVTAGQRVIGAAARPAAAIADRVPGQPEEAEAVDEQQRQDDAVGSEHGGHQRRPRLSHPLRPAGRVERRAGSWRTCAATRAGPRSARSPPRWRRQARSGRPRRPTGSSRGRRRRRSPRAGRGPSRPPRADPAAPGTGDHHRHRPAQEQAERQRRRDPVLGRDRERHEVRRLGSVREPGDVASACGRVPRPVPRSGFSAATSSAAPASHRPLVERSELGRRAAWRRCRGGRRGTARMARRGRPRRA